MLELCYNYPNRQKNAEIKNMNEVNCLRNKIFIGIFSGFILLVMLAAPGKMILTNLGVIEAENVGNIIEVDKVYEEGTFGAAFFNGIEEVKRTVNDIYTNYIPFYVSITSTASSFQQSLNQPVTSFLMNKGNELMLKNLEASKKPTETEPPVSSGEESETAEFTTEPVVTEPPYEPTYSATYLKGDSRHRYYQITAQETPDDPQIDFFVRIPALDNETLRPKMESQITKINDFQSRRPDVNWYVFPVTCFEDTILCDWLLPTESKRELFLEFESKLDEDVQFSYIDIKTFGQKDQLYYKTDHHWNCYGYTTGYSMIADMFKENYPDIEKLEPTFYEFDNQIFVQGSNARSTANYSLTENFHLGLFDIADHELTIDTGVSYGGRQTIQDRLADYLAGNFNKQRGYDHYIEYFRIAKKIVYPGNTTGRNLLIICDSYSPPLLEVLASHFDTTIVRYVDSNKSLPNMKYEDLIDQEGITDVLLLQMSDRVIYDYYNGSLLNLY